jgi:hypothetical protein
VALFIASVGTSDVAMSGLPLKARYNVSIQRRIGYKTTHNELMMMLLTYNGLDTCLRLIGSCKPQPTLEPSSL